MKHVEVKASSSSISIALSKERNGGKMFDLVEKTLTLDQQTLDMYTADAPRSLIG
jgi:hypothetical protein